MVDVVQGYIRFLKDEARRATKTASDNRLQEIRVRKEDLAVAQTERERVPLVKAMILASSGESFADATADQFHESCHKRGISLSFRAPMYAPGALR